MAVEQPDITGPPGNGEVLDDPDQFAIGEALTVGGIGGGGLRQLQPGIAQPGKGELAVEGRRIGAGALEMRCGCGLVAGGRGRAAHPVFGAREAERHGRDGRDLGEMSGCGLGIVQEFERIPTGVELGLGAIARRFAGVARRYAVGELGLVLLDQGAGDQTTLDPPGIGVHQLAGAAGRRQEQVGGLVDLVGAAQRADACIESKRIVTDRLGQSCQLAIGVLVALDRRDHRLCQGKLVLAEEGGDAQGIVGLTCVEQPIHARLVIGGGEYVTELGEDGLFVRLREILVAPEAADQRRGVLLAAAGDIGFGEPDRGAVRDGRRCAEGLDRGGGRQFLLGHRLFVAQAQEGLARPVAELLACRLDARGRHLVAAADGNQPVDDLDIDRVGQGIGRNRCRCRIVVVEQLEGELEPGRVQSRRDCRGKDGKRGRIHRRRIAGLRCVAVFRRPALVGGLGDERTDGIDRVCGRIRGEAGCRLRPQGRHRHLDGRRILLAGSQRRGRGGDEDERQRRERACRG